MHSKIQPYQDSFREQVLVVWEKSVRATHDFLLPSDIDYYKGIVSNINFNDFSVFCLLEDTVAHGFIGIAENKIEMLFISPEYIGKGLGRTLINFAISELNANHVDVNEQNLNAIQFYASFGFIPYDRSDLDSEGKNYPILKMKIKK